MKSYSVIAFFCLFCLLLTDGMAETKNIETEKVKIGAIFSKTGSTVVGYQSAINSIQLAVDEINEQGGILGKKIELTIFDNQSTALGSKQAAMEAAKAGVVSVIGCSYSSHSLAAAPVLQEAGIPMITPNSTQKDITLVGNYIFRACYIDSFQGLVMANFAAKDLKAKTAVVLKNVNSPFSSELSDFFIKRMKELNCNVILTGEYLEQSNDFSDMLEKVKQLNPDVIFLPGYVRDSAFIIKQARKMGIKSTFLGADGWANLMYQYADVELYGSYYSTHWHQEVAGEKSQKFVKNYSKKYSSVGNLIPSQPALVYDSLYLLKDSIERAGSLDPKKIRNQLAVTKNFEGVTGEITFDENRNPVNKPAVILKFDNKTSVFVKTITP